ncbi:MAG: hypothetical protein Q4E12_00445 [Coriobacteriia bacterium]|nr:hypothetical protein [Coriobacteriia bacterium]
MQDIALPLQDFLNSMDEDTAKAHFVRRLHAAFAQAIVDVYGLKAAALVLRHVQGVYVMDEEGQFPGNAKPPKLLRIYTDDPTIRADLDARQEFIKMNLAKQGFRADKVKLYASTFGMKERQPFADVLQRLASGETPAPAAPDTEDAYAEADEENMRKLLQVLKVGLCQVYGEQADDVVKSINAAYVRKQGKHTYGVWIYVPTETLRASLENHAEALCAHLRDLGVPATTVTVALAKPRMQGKQAFPALAAAQVI